MLMKMKFFVKSKLDEILNPYFNIRNLHAEIISIDNIIDKKVILEKI